MTSLLRRPAARGSRPQKKRMTATKASEFQCMKGSKLTLTKTRASLTAQHPTEGHKRTPAASGSR